MRLLSKITLVFYLLGFIELTFAQSEEYKVVINEISNNLKEVKASKSNFLQKLTSEENNSIVVQVEVLEQLGNKKNKSNNYEFNFADIDPNKVKYEIAKDVIKVELFVNEGEKFIKNEIGGKKVVYQSKCYLYATDIDNARNLVKRIKKIIPISKKNTQERLSLNGYRDMLTWLQNNIRDITYSEKNKLLQNFLIDSSYAGSVYYSVITENSSFARKNIYNFNLSSLDTSSIKLFNKKGFRLSLKTLNNQKSIKNIQDGKVKEYTNKVEFLCENIENCRELKRIFKKIIPLSKDEFERSMPVITSISQGVDELNRIVKKYTISEQKCEGGCIITFYRNTEGKGKIGSVWNFDLTDVNSTDSTGLDIKIREQLVCLTISTIKKNKLIKHLKNDVVQDYKNEIDLFFNSVEDAKTSKKILEKIIGLCKREVKSKQFSIQSLETEVGNVDFGGLAFEQSIEKLENNLLKFINKKKTNKKSEENVQEFKLKDINPKSVKMKVSGKKVMVEFATNYQEKIIKTYKNGEIKSYTNKVVILCNSIENGRKIAGILKGITGK